MKVSEIMSSDVQCTSPDSTLVEAAGLMRLLDVGAVPVCDHDRLAGMVTDRDLALKGIADGRDPNKVTVREVMSQGIVYVFEDQSLEVVAKVMQQKQLRRLPVLNHQKRLVGIVSLGDLSTHSQAAFGGQTLQAVSQPG